MKSKERAFRIKRDHLVEFKMEDEHSKDKRFG